MPRPDIAEDPEAMALVRQLAAKGYIDSDVGAAMVLLQEGPRIAYATDPISGRKVGVWRDADGKLRGWWEEPSDSIEEVARRGEGWITCESQLRQDPVAAAVGRLLFEEAPDGN